MDPSYTLKELEIMEVRMAEQELEIVNLQTKLSKTESGSYFKEAVRILRRIKERKGWYITKEIRQDILDLLEEVDNG